MKPSFYRVIILIIISIIGGGALGVLSSYHYFRFTDANSLYAGCFVGLIVSPLVVITCLHKPFWNSLSIIYIPSGVIAIAISFMNSIQISFGVTSVCFVIICFAVLFRIKDIPRPSLLCPQCGYDLRGSGLKGGCPECGWNRA